MNKQKYKEWYRQQRIGARKIAQGNFDRYGGNVVYVPFMYPFSSLRYPDTGVIEVKRRPEWIRAQEKEAHK